MGKKRILQKKKKTKGGEKGRPNWFTWTAVLSWKAAQKKKRKEGGEEKRRKMRGGEGEGLKHHARKTKHTVKNS